MFTFNIIMHLRDISKSKCNGILYVHKIGRKFVLKRKANT